MALASVYRPATQLLVKYAEKSAESNKKMINNKLKIFEKFDIYKYFLKW